MEEPSSCEQKYKKDGWQSAQKAPGGSKTWNSFPPLGMHLP
jgi:hypothetical protein